MNYGKSFSPGNPISEKKFCLAANSQGTKLTDWRKIAENWLFWTVYYKRISICLGQKWSPSMLCAQRTLTYGFEAVNHSPFNSTQKWLFRLVLNSCKERGALSLQNKLDFHTHKLIKGGPKSLSPALFLKSPQQKYKKWSLLQRQDHKNVWNNFKFSLYFLLEGSDHQVLFYFLGFLNAGRLEHLHLVIGFVCSMLLPVTRRQRPVSSAWCNDQGLPAMSLGWADLP